MTEGYRFSGTLLHNNFSLFLNPSTLFQLDLPNGNPIIHLLTHEMKHVWIGNKILPPVGMNPAKNASNEALDQLDDFIRLGS